MASAPKLETQRVLLSRLTRPCEGLLPMGWVQPTSFVHGLISEMLSESKLETKISPPSGFMAKLTGVLPTSSRARRWSSISEGSCLAAQEPGAAERLMAITWCPAEQAMKALEESGRMTASVAPGQP